MATVIVPTPLRKFTGNAARVAVPANSVAAALDELTRLFPELKTRLRNADGGLPAFLNIFVDEEDIRVLNQEQTRVTENTVISIVPAIAGGSTQRKA